jgi:hypothetical protein
MNATKIKGKEERERKIERWRRKRGIKEDGKRI